MMPLDYENFDICIEGSDGVYRIRTTGNAGGESKAEVKWEITEEQFNAFLYEIGKPRRRTRRARSRTYEAAKEFGGRLHDMVFVGNIGASLQSSLANTKARDLGLRVRLRLSDAPDLRNLPWELLFDKARNDFLAHSAATPVVRYLDLPEPISALPVSRALRILVVISSPSGLAQLDAEREWRNLQEALAELVERGLVDIQRLDAAQLTSLSGRLSRETFHVLHFIGHGEYDDEAERGELVFEDVRGKSDYVPADKFATVVKNCRALRLVVLNSCDGARDAPNDPFAGTAQALVQRGIPAVIAMQFEITDEAAITFAGTFYRSLAIGLPIDTSLSHARLGIYASGNDIEWATPVLYLRASDGKIFDVAQSAEVREQAASNEANRLIHDAEELEKRLQAEEQDVARRKTEEAIRQQAKQAEARAQAAREAQNRAEEQERERAREEARLRAKRDAERHAMEEAEWQQARQAEAREQARRETLEYAEEQERERKRHEARLQAKRDAERRAAEEAKWQQARQAEAREQARREALEYAEEQERERKNREARLRIERDWEHSKPSKKVWQANSTYNYESDSRKITFVKNFKLLAFLILVILVMFMIERFRNRQENECFRQQLDGVGRIYNVPVRC